MKEDQVGPGHYNPALKSKTAGPTEWKKPHVLSKKIQLIQKEKKGAQPGPGSYQVANQETSAPSKAKLSSVFASGTGRQPGSAVPHYKPPKKGQSSNPMQDIIDDDSDDDITPGPGDYYDHQHSTFYSKSKPERLQFFGSTSTRFTGKVKPSGAGVLGPGSYDVA